MKRFMDHRSRSLCRSIVDTFRAGGRGHLASAFSLVEIMRVLFDDVLRFDPLRPDWEERDRFLLSKGHGCLALYAILADKGFFPATELATFCRMGTRLGGHPDHRLPGVEASTGSLGHGLSLGVGMALNARFAKNGARVFVLMGDGECNEGSVWEAALSATKHGLDNLTVLVDCNGWQSYGRTSEVLDLEPFADKWRSFGFAVSETDGHDLSALRRVLTALPLAPGQPNAVICRTVKGKGVRLCEHNPGWHHKNKISPEETAALYRELEN